MSVSIDLRRAHLHRPYGDILAIWSWINDERALFLIPRHRKGAPWYVVMEPAAHTWSDQDPKNIMAVVAKAYKACEVLGIEPNPTNCRRIAGIVNDAIPELVRMPSAPPVQFRPESYGQMVLRADGQEIAADEIRVEAEGAATYG